MKTIIASIAIFSYTCLMLSSAEQKEVKVSQANYLKTVGCYSQVSGDLVITKRKVDQLQHIKEQNAYRVTDYDGGDSTVFNVDCKVESQIQIASK